MIYPSKSLKSGSRNFGLPAEADPVWFPRTGLLGSLKALRVASFCTTPRARKLTHSRIPSPTDPARRSLCAPASARIRLVTLHLRIDLRAKIAWIRHPRPHLVVQVMSEDDASNGGGSHGSTLGDRRHFDVAGVNYDLPVNSRQTDYLSPFNRSSKTRSSLLGPTSLRRYMVDAIPMRMRTGTIMVVYVKSTWRMCSIGSIIVALLLR